MNCSILFLIISLLAAVTLSAQLYSCIKEAFNSSCKTQLYQCTNDPECSYQLHQNTQHIFLNQNSQTFPELYFSNKLAVSLYQCLRPLCSLPAIQQNYPKTLPFEYCLMEVYDICRGDIEHIYRNPSESSEDSQCYRKYCNFPKLAHS